MERRIIDQQLDILQDKLLLLGGSAETAVHNAMRSLTERDSQLAQKVIDDDKLINRLELEIDQLSVEILALQQPAAYDLRLVISIAKITPVLERIADHAANIAESALVLNNEPEFGKYVDFPKMADIAVEMLKSSLDAFTHDDSKLSRKIIKRDKKIDKIYRKVFTELIEMMLDKPEKAASAAQLLFVAKALERIGDYVKDICELSVYLAEAVFIKHKQSIKELDKAETPNE